jgi:hypothetical protein
MIYKKQADNAIKTGGKFSTLGIDFFEFIRLFGPDKNKWIRNNNKKVKEHIKNKDPI